MAIQIVGGVSGSVAGVSSEAAEGLHTINKPQDYGSLGHYAMVLTTGTIAAGAAALGEYVQMRWVDATRFCLIHEVQVLEFRNVATAWTAGRFLFDLCIVRPFTADGTGGNAVGVAEPQGQLRTSMGATLFSTGFRLATTAALGTAGTHTLDTNPVGATFGMVDAVAAKYHIPQSNVVATASPAAGVGIPLWKVDIASGEHPIVLKQDEGVVIRATVPATGTWAASFLVKWSEVDYF
jgi:hypothetical protein